MQYVGLMEKEMKALKLVLCALVVFASIGQVFARCDYPSDRAADGSRCGSRAASERAGGR
jgi:hypothetical protein